MEEEILTLEINEELANKYNGRCFIDHDMNDRIEAFMFVKHDKGISTRFVGCDFKWGYDFVNDTEYGTWTSEQESIVGYIHMIEECQDFIEETTTEKFKLAVSIAHRQMALEKKLMNEFKSIQSNFFGKEGTK
jgi:hypothetical protein